MSENPLEFGMVREKMPQEPLITHVKPRTIDADVLQLLIHSVQVLIAQYPPEIIIAVMNDLQASYLARWRKRLFLLLPVYYALASLIFLTDIVATNAFFHRLFTALYLPVPERGGWYYSAFLAILCQSYCLLPLIQGAKELAIFRRSITYRDSDRYLTIPLYRALCLFAAVISLWLFLLIPALAGNRWQLFTVSTVLAYAALGTAAYALYRTLLVIYPDKIDFGRLVAALQQPQQPIP